jgi:hypothetical protein
MVKKQNVTFFNSVNFTDWEQKIALVEEIVWGQMDTTYAHTNLEYNTVLIG